MALVTLEMGREIAWRKEIEYMGNYADNLDEEGIKNLKIGIIGGGPIGCTILNNLFVFIKCKLRSSS